MTRVPIRALLIALAVGACSGGPLAVCTDELRVSLRVSVVDAVTGASAATGSTIILRGAAFQDSVVLTEDAPYVRYENAAGPGIYNVTVRKQGYRDCVQRVRIQRGRCHVEPQTQVTALLQPE